MAVDLGRVVAIFRYPVKSMRSEPLDAAAVGWHGLDGDRRLALRRLDPRGGFPWLSASSFPDLVRYAPRRDDGAPADTLPASVRTPDGRDLPVFGDELAQEIERRSGIRVEMTHLRNGTFDDGAVSVITAATCREVCRLGGVAPDFRRLRPNVVLETTPATAFGEDAWVGGVLEFGEGEARVALAVTARDVRCAMVNIHPDDGTLSPEVLKGVVRANANHAGVYAAVTRTGRVAVGDPVRLRR